MSAASLRGRRNRIGDHPYVGRNIERPQRIPAHLSGRWRHDPVFTTLTLAAKIVLGGGQRLELARLPQPPASVRRLTVVRREVVAHDDNVVAFWFASGDGAPLPPWFPGAHLGITLPSGRKRHYSLCGDPADRDHYRIAVRRVPAGGGGSVELHERIDVGDSVTTLGPRNGFPFIIPGHGSPTRRVRFIAGGIGITPLLPMAALAQTLGVDWSMILVGRSRDSLPFLEELRRFGSRVSVRTDDEHGIPDAAALLADVDSDTAVYVCGPEAMLALIRRAAATSEGDLADRVNRTPLRPRNSRWELHWERFAGAPVQGERPFSVQLVTGEETTVGADESTLTALRRVRPGQQYSCQQGFCGSCRVRVHGEVDHRDFLLTDSERAAGDMLPCVSRAAAGEDRLTVE